MCFHCEQGNTQHHIPTVSRVLVSTIEGVHCTACGSGLTNQQAAGLSPHYCFGRYIMINSNPKWEPKPEGYHRKEIRRGVFGELSKIREELDELEDAAEQNVRVMVGCELSDLYGALRAYADRQGFTMVDLEKMADISKKVFESGYRKSKN